MDDKKPDFLVVMDALMLEQLNALGGNGRDPKFYKPISHAWEAYDWVTSSRRIYGEASYTNKAAYLLGGAILGDKSMKQIELDYLKAIEALSPAQRAHIEKIAQEYERKMFSANPLFKSKAAKAGDQQALYRYYPAEQMMLLYQELALKNGRSQEQIEKMFPSLKKKKGQEVPQVVPKREPVPPQKPKVQPKKGKPEPEQKPRTAQRTGLA